MIHRLLISSSTPSNLSPVSEFDNGRISYRLPQTKLIAVYVSGGLVRKNFPFFFTKKKILFYSKPKQILLL